MTQNLDNTQARLVAGETLTPAEERRLNVAMRVRSDLPDAIARDLRMHNLLSSRQHVEQTADDFTARVMRSVQVAPPLPPSARPSFPAVNETSADWSRQSRVGSRRHTKLLFGIAGGCALLLAIGVTLLLIFANRGERDRRNRDMAKPDGERPGTVKSQAIVEHKKSQSRGNTKIVKRDVPNKQPAGPFVRLTDGRGCRWKGATPATDISKPETITLLTGTAEFTFADGAVVNLVGPSSFELSGLGRMRLRQGKLHAEVPKAAVGFTVETPTSIIVDLGTKFEVTVDAAGNTDLKVLEGRVEHRRRASDSTSEEIRVLSAGESHRESPRQTSKPKRTVGQNKRPATRTNGPITVGVLIINGRSYRYSSQEEYEKLRKKLNLRRP